MHNKKRCDSVKQGASRAGATCCDKRGNGVTDPRLRVESRRLARGDAVKMIGATRSACPACALLYVNRYFNKRSPPIQAFTA